MAQHQDVGENHDNVVQLKPKQKKAEDQTITSPKPHELAHQKSVYLDKRPVFSEKDQPIPRANFDHALMADDEPLEDLLSETQLRKEVFFQFQNVESDGDKVESELAMVVDYMLEADLSEITIKGYADADGSTVKDNARDAQQRAEYAQDIIIELFEQEGGDPDNLDIGLEFHIDAPIGLVGFGVERSD